MYESTAKFFGYLVLVLGIIGLIAGEKQLLGFLNIDFMLDALRILLAALLLYAVYVARDEKFIRMSLMVLGVLYVGMGLIGTVSSDMLGLLPHGLSLFDKVFHLVAGVAAIGIVSKAMDRHHSSHA